MKSQTRPNPTRYCAIFNAQCVRYNESSRYCHDVRPSVRPSVCLGRACIVIIRSFTVHVSADLSLWLDISMFWAP